MDKKPKKRRMSDISRKVPIKKVQKADSSDKPDKVDKVERNKVDKEIRKKLEEIDKQVEEFEKEEEKRFKAEEVKKIKRKGSGPKKAVILTSIVVLLAVLVYLGIFVLPKADIKITTKKAEWKFIDSIAADKGVAEFLTSSKEIPAEVFSLVKNFSFSFPASGKKNVERKATGKITIYNAYSSSPQALVATTRFMSPDGKIFRLDNKVTVPGASVVGGEIIPSKIEVSVTADKAGPEYNIESSHFNIPGFQGSDKYQGFYGESEEVMKGGFIGEQPFPTDDDVEQAQEKARNDLRDYIVSLLMSQIPEDFKIIDGSKQFVITEEEIKKEVDENGNFNIFLEGEYSIIAFKESSLLDLVSSLAKSELGEDFEISSNELEYGAARADFEDGRISFAVEFKGMFEIPVNIDDFRSKTLSKSEEEMKALISSYSNIEKASISFRPFWVKSVPKNEGRVRIEVE